MFDKTVAVACSYYDFIPLSLIDLYSIFVKIQFTLAVREINY